jgi:hypothetical protein
MLGDSIYVCFMVVRNIILIESAVSQEKEQISLGNLSFVGP